MKGRYDYIFHYRKLFFQAEDGIRDVERSRGLGDVYKRQQLYKEKNRCVYFLIQQ